MTPAIAGIGIAALLLAGTAQPPAQRASAGAWVPVESAAAGQRVESDSFTSPREIARCIAYNINRKMPELSVRQRAAASADESGYLILSAAYPSPATFGVIRIDAREAGSHLTTWLPGRTLAASAEDIARRLVAGC